MKHPLAVQSCAKTVEEVADHLEEILRSKNIQVFARIDHGKAAKAAGLVLQDEQMLIFGDPKVGTLLMQECPAIGVELPLKILIWQDDHHTNIGYSEPKLLLEDYELTEHRVVIEKMSLLMANLVAELVKVEH